MSNDIFNINRAVGLSNPSDHHLARLSSLFDLNKIGVAYRDNFVPLYAITVRESHHDQEVSYYFKPRFLNATDHAATNYADLFDALVANGRTGTAFYYTGSGVKRCVIVHKGCIVDSNNNILLLIATNGVSHIPESEREYQVYMSYNFMFDDHLKTLYRRIMTDFIKLNTQYYNVTFLEPKAIDDLFFNAYQIPNFPTVSEMVTYTNSLNDYNDLYSDAPIKYVTGLEYQLPNPASYDMTNWNIGTPKGLALMADIIENGFLVLGDNTRYYAGDIGILMSMRKTDNLEIRIQASRYRNHRYHQTIDSLRNMSVNVNLRTKVLTVVGMTYSINLEDYNVYERFISEINESAEDSFNFVNDSDTIEAEINVYSDYDWYHGNEAPTYIINTDTTTSDNIASMLSEEFNSTWG